MYRLLKYIYKKFNMDAIHNSHYERMPIQEQKKFLNSLPDTKDDYQQSYNKYKCFCEYCYYKRKWVLLIYNIGAFIIYPFMYKKYCKRGENVKRTTQGFDAVVENIPRLKNTDILPEEINEQYSNILEIEAIDYKNIYLNREAKEICEKLIKCYYWKPYFRIIIMMKLAQFSQYIEEFNPKAIVFYSCEREFSSPLQTLLCEQEGIKYISYMHGDYLYKLCFAFQKYSKYYIWDETYREFFSSLKCTFPMNIYKPAKLKGIAREKNERECEYFATYYFSNETNESIATVYSIFSKFEKMGLQCKVRPHPRFSNTKEINKVFKDIFVEDILNYTLEQSIEESLYIVGLNTTVLTQAYYSNKRVVIDDVSMRKEYQELKEEKYIMLNRKHELLSQIVKIAEDGMVYDESYKFFAKRVDK